ncbi:hypothetical protein HQ585_18530 [candidate division KSB1 bacterium]|nr:hypothetical protein [candidate division KSB1 bacterium]
MINCMSRFLILFWCSTTAIAQTLSDRQIHYRPGDWISYPVTRFVNSVTLDEETIYFGTTGGILQYKFYENLWDAPITVSDGLAGGAVTALIYDNKSSRLWAATSSLCYREPASEYWYVFSQSELGHIQDLGVSSQAIWVAASNGIWKVDRLSLRLSKSDESAAEKANVQWGDAPWKYNEESPEHFFVDNSYLWFPEGYVQDTHLRRFELTNTLQDGFSNLWIGTWGLGAGVAELHTKSLKFLPFGIWSPDVQAMTWDDTGLWVGGLSGPDESGGISYWNLDSDQWIYYEAPFISHLYSHEVNAIVAGENAVWFGTREGLSRYDQESERWRTWTGHDGLWSDEVTTLALVDRNLWIGTPAGINRFYIKEEVLEQVRERALIHRTINHLEPDGEDLWAATDQGLFHYMGEEQLWQVEPGYRGLLYQEAWSVSANEDEVWVATDDGIMVLNKETGEWDGFTMSQHFEYDVFHHILADKDAVWVGTNEGVLKYNKEEARWRRFTTEDGLLDNRVQWLMLEGSYVWFGTPLGLTRFFWNAPYRQD